MKSASELAIEIGEMQPGREYYKWDDSIELTTNQLMGYILSDRRAMMERYKEAIKKAEAKSKKLQLCANDAIAALDSAFAEIEGGK